MVSTQKHILSAETVIKTFSLSIFFLLDQQFSMATRIIFFDNFLELGHLFVRPNFDVA
jgi:hypothetical protein